MTVLQLPTPPKIRASNFSLQRLQAINPMRGGHHQAVDLGEPLWTCEISTTELSRAQGGQWKYFLARLRGALRTLYLYDASRKRPLAYASSADGAEPLIGKSSLIGRPRKIDSLTRAWGAPVIDAVDRENSRVRLRNGLAGAIISDGDYGHWDDGPTRRLYILGAAVLDSGGNAWVSVEPAPPATSANLPAPFEMNKACAEFVVFEADAPYSAPVTHQVTLKAAQVLRRS